MSLLQLTDPAFQAELRELIRRCTARITSGSGKSNGAGVFIDAGLVLTCAHVVKAGDKVSVLPYRREARGGKVLDTSTVDDLALVELDEVDLKDPQPAVLLHAISILDDASVFAAGYPKDDAEPGGMEVITYTINQRNAPDSRLLNYQLRGNNVTFGMSGGPVVNSATATVGAIVRYSKDLGGVVGGGAIPIARAAQRFELVRRCLEEPPLATREWRELVGEDRWQRLGLPGRWSRRIDVRLAGNRSKWLVGVDNREHTLTVRDLPDEVAEVLFQWIQRGRVRAEAEVQLLGRLLSAALFPDKIKSRFLEVSLAHEVLVRLQIEGDALIDVPWELATVPVGAGGFLATDPKYRFVRVVSHEAPVAPNSKSAAVLGIVVQKEDPERAPVAYEEGRLVDWPPLDKMVNALRIALERPAFRPIVLPNPQPMAVDRALRREPKAPMDVVHYLGYGRLNQQGDAQLAFSDGGDGLRWSSARDFFGWAARSGARLLVLEFSMPPHGMELETVPPSALLEAMQGRVNAIVCTRIPAHALQLKEFNEEFYNSLASSENVEAAVQVARERLDYNRPLDDHAGFGWFTLITGKQAGLRLVVRDEPPRPVAEGPQPQAEPIAAESSSAPEDVYAR